MSTDYIMDISREVVWTIVRISAPLLIISLVIGLIISIFQTITSIQEQTLTFVPKILTVFLVLILTGNWILNNIVAFIQDICSRFGDFVG